ncbi:hypothetical protein VNO80_05240 [Phaseolus coccineus]|uniref:Secreted protein n=1 Tax=Phaseolus coccineus TaxID=3886 RepID=A0AAN9NJS0_PHACN
MVMSCEVIIRVLLTLHSSLAGGCGSHFQATRSPDSATQVRVTCPRNFVSFSFFGGSDSLTHPLSLPTTFLLFPPTSVHVCPSPA